MHNMRQSVLNDGDICLRRLTYNYDPQFPRTGGEAKVTGTGYHAGLEHYYRLRMEIDECPPITSSLMLDVYEAIQLGMDNDLEISPIEQWDTSYIEALQRAQNMAHAYFSQGQQVGPEWHVIGVEDRFKLPLWDGWQATGTIDLVLVHENGDRFKIEDHKTGKKKWRAGKGSPRKSNQIPWYSMATQQLYGRLPEEFSYGIMTYGCDFERRVYEVRQADVEATAAKAKMYTALLDSGMELPGNTSATLCDERWCDYWDACPFGRALADGVIGGELLTVVGEPSQEE